MAFDKLFPGAPEMRNTSRGYLIIHNEVRSIENAILFASESGLLDAVVFNTYMTDIALPTFQDFLSMDISTDVITVTNHGLEPGQEIEFTTDDTLPTPLATSQIYYARVLNTNEFQVSQNYLDTINGFIIDLIDVGTGNHKVRRIAPNQQYYRTWKGTREDRSLLDQMNAVIRYFKDLGYSIRRETNPNTGTTFQWRIEW